MARWMSDLRRRDRARHRGRQWPRAGARSHGEERPATGRARSADACCRPARCARRAWAGHAAARLRRGRLVGAGRRGRAAGAAPRRRARPHGRRPVRGARRQDRAARRRRRPRHRGRPLAARLERLRENLARLHLSAEIVAADVTNGRRAHSTRCCSMRPARRPARSAAIPTSPGSSSEADIAALAGLQRRLIAQAAELTKPGGILVYCTCSLEPEEGERGRGRSSGAQARLAAPADRGCRGWTAAPSCSRRRATCARCRAICPIPIRAWPASTASMPHGCEGFEGLSAVGRGPTLRYVPAAGVTTPARRGASASMSRVSVAERTRLSVFLARGLVRRLSAA